MRPAMLPPPRSTDIHGIPHDLLHIPKIKYLIVQLLSETDVILH